MDLLDYVESRTTHTLDYVRKSYDDLHERAYKAATLLVAGGGAMIGYALGQIAPDVPPVTWAPIGALALSWFAIAAALLWNGATSNTISPGNGSKNLLDYFGLRMAETSDRASAIAATRLAELSNEQSRLEGLQAGCKQRALAIDHAYKAAAVVSPLVVITTAGICAHWF